MQLQTWMSDLVQDSVIESSCHTAFLSQVAGCGDKALTKATVIVEKKRQRR